MERCSESCVVNLQQTVSIAPVQESLGSSCGVGAVCCMYRNDRVCMQSACVLRFCFCFIFFSSLSFSNVQI